MRGKEARCPECGADVSFARSSSVLRVCSYCRSVLVRTDVDVEKIGKVAMLAEVPSPLGLGMRGTAYGGFSVVGRLQLDHGAGTWNEWYLGLDSGKWLWLAEAQGRYYLTTPIGELRDVPLYGDVHLGHSVRVPTPEGGALTMHIVEAHRAAVVSAEGELPFRVDPQEPLYYADLSGPKRSFGTLDYGPHPGAAPTAYVGRQVDLVELGLVAGSAPVDGNPPRRQTTKAARLQCPECQGALELRAPDSTLRVTCPYCAALIDVSGEPLRALQTLRRDPAAHPRLTLGAKATLRGSSYTVLGFLRRRIADRPFTWDEYVLDGGAAGFHYLIESDGHFTLVRPAHVGDVQGSGETRSYEGVSYRRVEQVRALVVHVDGEFPWEVEVGEEALVEDFWAQGWMLSLERSQGAHRELSASVGEYLDPKEVFTAFGLKGSPPRRTYIAPHQPNPHRAVLDRQRRVLWPALAVMGALMMIFSIVSAGRRSVVRFDLTTVAGVEPGAEHIFLSEPFQLGKGGRAAVEAVLAAPEIQNSWIDADVALINDEDGTAHQFAAGVSYYSGVEAGESWREGSRRASVVIPSVSSGRYVLRVEPSWAVLRECSASSDCGFLASCDGGKCRRPCSLPVLGCQAGEVCQGDRCVLDAIPYSITLRHGTPRTGWGGLFLVLLVLFPLITWIRASAFEGRRMQDMVE